MVAEMPSMDMWAHGGLGVKSRLEIGGSKVRMKGKSQ
jgi:hypothetical protein